MGDGGYLSKDDITNFARGCTGILEIDYLIDQIAVNVNCLRTTQEEVSSLRRKLVNINEQIYQRYEILNSLKSNAIVSLNEYREIKKEAVQLEFQRSMLLHDISDYDARIESIYEKIYTIKRELRELFHKHNITHIDIDDLDNG